MTECKTYAAEVQAKTRLVEQLATLKAQVHTLQRTTSSIDAVAMTCKDQGDFAITQLAGSDQLSDKKVLRLQSRQNDSNAYL